MLKETRINRVEAFLIDVFVKRTWEISLIRTETRSHVLLEVETESGIIGFGKVSPLPAFLGKDTRFIANIINSLLAPALIGIDDFDLASHHLKMNRIIHGNCSGKGAVDIAFHDFLERILDIPVFQLLGRKVRNEVSLSYVVGIREH